MEEERSELEDIFEDFEARKERCERRGHHRINSVETSMVRCWDCNRYYLREDINYTVMI